MGQNFKVSDPKEACSVVFNFVNSFSGISSCKLAILKTYCNVCITRSTTYLFYLTGTILWSEWEKRYSLTVFFGWFTKKPLQAKSRAFMRTERSSLALKNVAKSDFIIQASSYSRHRVFPESTQYYVMQDTFQMSERMCIFFPYSDLITLRKLYTWFMICVNICSIETSKFLSF